MLNGCKLECVATYTYLGIIIDCNLSLNQTIDKLFNSAISMVYMLGKIRQFIYTKTAVIILKSHILSQLEYGSILAIGANKGYLDKVQKLINRSLRICYKKPIDTRVYELHVMGKILPLRIRRQIGISKLMFQVLTEKESVELWTERTER